MNYKSNKFKSITKGLMGSNIIFPAAYILFSAKTCPGLFSQGEKVHIGTLSSSSSELKQENGLEGLHKTHYNVSGVPALLGRGTLCNLDGYQCGVFVASETKEVWMVKLPSKDGWMCLGELDDASGLLRVRYDSASDPHIIKIDHTLFERLHKPFNQPSSDKEAFWHKIENDDTWRAIQFCYKEAVGDRAIFKEEGITSSTEFTKQLHQQFSSANRLISQTLSISGSVTSTALKDLETKGFLLVKDKDALGTLVKNMLESGAEWGTKAAVVDVKDYLTCPAELVDDLLQFDSSSLEMSLQDGYANLRLEDYGMIYCYLKDGKYDRLITLENVKSLIKIDKAIGSENPYYWNQAVYVPEKVTTVIPPEQPVHQEGSASNNATDGQPKDETKSEDITNEQVNSVNDEHTVQITNSPEEGSTQNANHTQPVRISPSTVPPPPMPNTNAGPVSPPPPPPMPNTNAAQVPPPPPPMPNTNAGSSNNEANPNDSGRSALLDQIRQGKALKRVSKEPKSNEKPPKIEDPRDALLTEIRQGKALKRVSKEPKSNEKPPKIEDPRDALLAEIRQGKELRKVEGNQNKKHKTPDGIAGAISNQIPQPSKESTEGAISAQESEPSRKSKLATELKKRRNATKGKSNSSQDGSDSSSSDSSESDDEVDSDEWRA